MTGVDHTSTIIIMGDFNMKSITGLTDGDNKFVEKYMKNKYNLHQIVNEQLQLKPGPVLYKYNTELIYCIGLLVRTLPVAINI